MTYARILKASLAVATLLSLTPALLPAEAAGIGDEALTPGACPAALLKDSGAYYIELRITGLRSAKGRVTVDFYGSNPNDFLAKGKKIIKVHLQASPQMVKGCVKLPRPGRYAIAGYHDENGDHHFNRTWVGMPAEGYTFSRDPDALILPSYKDTAFETKGRITPVVLKFHYP